MDNYHNDYNHSFDAINIANGSPQYIGSGVLGPIKNSTSNYDYGNYKKWSAMSKAEKIFAILFFIVFIILLILSHWDFFMSLIL